MSMIRAEESAATRLNGIPAVACRVAIAIVAGMVLQGPALLTDSGVATAQEEEKDEKAPMKGRKTESLSKKVYEAITEANELVDKEDYNGARKVLDRVKAMPKLSEYETAQLYSFYGFLYFNAENYVEAKKAYNTVLQQPELPEALQQQTIRTLAQLAFVTEDYPQAIEYANKYINDVGPDADMYVVIGTAYYQMEKFDQIVPPVSKAIQLANEKGQKTKEQWLLLLRVAYWEQGDYGKVKEILEQLVVGWPKKEYWTQLSGVYYELKDEPRQLAAYEAAYDQGLLESSAELVQMAQLFMQSDIPYKGARVMEKGLEAEAIERTERNLRLYSQAWQLAQEDRKAIDPLKEAAGMSDDGELYSRLAQSYLNLSEYSQCIDASNKAVSKGGLKNPGNAYLVLGMCQFEKGSLSSAKGSFRKAARHDKAAKNAASWISYVDNELERKRQLEESLRRVRDIEAGGNGDGEEPEAADAEETQAS